MHRLFSPRPKWSLPSPWSGITVVKTRWRTAFPRHLAFDREPGGAIPPACRVHPSRARPHRKRYRLAGLQGDRDWRGFAPPISATVRKLGIEAARHRQIAQNLCDWRSCCRPGSHLAMPRQTAVRSGLMPALLRRGLARTAHTDTTLREVLREF